MAESIAHQIGGINNQITDEFGTQNDLEVTGGGKGWTARTTKRDGSVAEAKGSSKLAAAQALYDLFAQGEPEGDFEGMTEGEAAKCVAECMASVKPYCECKCGGKNHGAASGAGMKARLGLKSCLCGCGGETLRLFVPGHDARYHAAQRRAAAAAAAGLDPDAYAVQQAEARREANRLRRNAKRAEYKAQQEAVAAKVRDLLAKPKPAVEPGDDDLLPF